MARRQLLVDEYFRLAVWLPIVLPLAISAVLQLRYGIPFDPTPSLLTRVKNVLEIVAAYGIPYAAYAVLLTRRSHRMSERDILRELWRGPVLFTLVMVLINDTVLLVKVPGDEKIPSVLAGTVLVVAGGLVVGYAYALVIYVAFRGLRALGVVARSPAPGG